MVLVADVVSAPPPFTENVYTFEVPEGSYNDVSCKVHQDGFISYCFDLQAEVGAVRAVDAENPGTAVIRYEQITRGQ